MLRAFSRGSRSDIHGVDNSVKDKNAMVTNPENRRHVKHGKYDNYGHDGRHEEHDLKSAGLSWVSVGYQLGLGWVSVGYQLGISWVSVGCRLGSGETGVWPRLSACFSMEDDQSFQKLISGRSVCRHGSASLNEIAGKTV
jgi:hypothetical protein